MEELIKFIVTSIVDKPQDFKLDKQTTDSGFINFIIDVAPEDMGRIIGKRGQIIKAMRILLRTRALSEGKKVFLTLKEKQNSSFPFKAD